MKLEEKHQKSDYLAWSEPEFQEQWLDEAFLNGSEVKHLDSEGDAETALDFGGRYTYELWRWKSVLWRGSEKTAGYQGFHILAELAQMGLPVCRPLAVRVQRKGLSARTLVLTYQLVEAEAFPVVLKSRSIPENIWQQLGALLRQLHDLNISVKDLSLDDFVLNSQAKPYLRKVHGFSRKDADSGVWKQIELQSLLTSIVKLRESEAAFYFEDSDWLALTQAYMTRARPNPRDV